MKKNFCLLLFAMLVSLAVSAQRFEYQLGLKAGAGVAFLGVHDDNIVGKDNGFTYKFGLTGSYYFGENYGFTSGFNVIGSDLSYKVKIVDDKEEELTVDRNLKNTYCQVPFLLKMRTDSFANKLRVLGEIGYGMNFKVSEHDKNDFHHKYRDVCSSLIVHLGVEIEVLNRSTLLLMLGYDNFFSNMMSSSNDYKVTMSNLCFEIGFLF